MLNWLSKFRFLGKVWTCAKFVLRRASGGVGVGGLWGGKQASHRGPHRGSSSSALCWWSGVVVLHSSDHHDLWSLVNWQSGSWVATITLADRLRETERRQITTGSLHDGTQQRRKVRQARPGRGYGSIPPIAPANCRRVTVASSKRLHVTWCDVTWSGGTDSLSLEVRKVAIESFDVKAAHFFGAWDHACLESCYYFTYTTSHSFLYTPVSSFSCLPSTL